MEAEAVEEPSDPGVFGEAWLQTWDHSFATHIGQFLFSDDGALSAYTDFAVLLDCVAMVGGRLCGDGHFASVERMQVEWPLPPRARQTAGETQEASPERQAWMDDPEYIDFLRQGGSLDMLGGRLRRISVSLNTDLFLKKCW